MTEEKIISRLPLTCPQCKKTAAPTAYGFCSEACLQTYAKENNKEYKTYTCDRCRKDAFKHSIQAMGSVSADDIIYMQEVEIGRRRTSKALVCHCGAFIHSAGVFCDGCYNELLGTVCKLLECGSKLEND